MPFKTARDIQIILFQYRIIHRTIGSNEWLNNLTIKSTKKCNFFEHTESIIHFFLMTVKKQINFERHGPSCGNC